jgi:hypothetical protein
LGEEGCGKRISEAEKTHEKQSSQRKGSFNSVINPMITALN